MKKQFKRAIALVISILLCCAMAACSNQEPATPAEPAAPAAPADSSGSDASDAGGAGLKFGYINYNFQDQWAAASMEGFLTLAKEYGVEVVTIDGALEPEKYVNGMNDLISQGVDAICIFTLTPELDKTCADIAIAAGIPFVFENALPSEDTQGHLATVMCEYTDTAYQSMKHIGDLWPGAKVFFAAGTLGMGVTELYFEGIEKAVSDGLDVEYVGYLVSDWTAEGAMNTTADFIQSGAEFDVVYANCDIMGVGAISALKEAGLFGEKKVYTPGGSPETMDLVRQGEQDATLNIATPAQGGMAFRILYDYVAEGKSPAQNVYFTPLIPVNPDTMDQALDWNDTSKVGEVVKNILG